MRLSSRNWKHSTNKMAEIYLQEPDGGNSRYLAQFRDEGKQSDSVSFSLDLFNSAEQRIGQIMFASCNEPTPNVVSLTLASRFDAPHPICLHTSPTRRVIGITDANKSVLGTVGRCQEGDLPGLLFIRKERYGDVIVPEHLREPILLIGNRTVSLPPPGGNDASPLGGRNDRIVIKTVNPSEKPLIIGREEEGDAVTATTYRGAEAFQLKRTASGELVFDVPGLSIVRRADSICAYLTSAENGLWAAFEMRQDEPSKIRFYNFEMHLTMTLNIEDADLMMIGENPAIIERLGCVQITGPALAFA